MGIKRGSTLFEAVPALSTMVPQTSGVLKLVPLINDVPHVVLRKGRNLIGRDKEQVDHHIDAHQISRVHCEINVSEQRITIHDLGSHNGTYVNNERIEDHDLKMGDEIGVSRTIAFRLVRDQELTSPMHMDLDVGEAEPTLMTDRPQPARMTGEIEHGGGSPAAEDYGAFEPPTNEALAQERDLAVVLYQIAMGCLMSDDKQERETLLSNVLPRLTEMDAGFILHQSDRDWRASICPAREEPTDVLLKGSYKLARERLTPILLEEPADLATLGMRGGGALVVPLIFNERLIGVVGVISHQRPFTPETLDIVDRFADICAASLRD